MSAVIPVTISLAVQFGSALPPAGRVLKSVVLEITDASGTQLPAITLNGSETPTPWQATAQVQPGAGQVNVQNIDTTGTLIGSSIDVPYDTGSAPTSQPLATGLSVTVVPASGTTTTPSTSSTSAASPPASTSAASESLASPHTFKAPPSSAG